MPNKIQKLWKVMDAFDNDFALKYPESSKIILQLLYNRGLKEKQEVDDFLNPEYAKSYDPFLFKDMEAAVELVIKHAKAKNKIVIYGDYDADGVTSSAVLHDVFTALRVDVLVYIPDRVSEGYGLNKSAMDEINKMGAKLVITVDCGVRNKEEVAYAKSLGMDVIITDHHIAPENESDYPDCLIINPITKNEKYPFKYLSGVGVAFKLAKALISKSKLSKEDKIKLEESVLDLVAIGTVADCVNTFGENRILIKKGLEVMNLRKRKGLEELINVAQINGNKLLDTWNISFQIAPRLNAAGRMDHANTAFELLVTKDKKEAEEIAKRLNERNTDRQVITEEIVRQVEEQVNIQDKIIIGVCSNDESWEEGVIGLVAGKITEKYYKPTLVITKSEHGYKGSGRSIEELNIIKTIEECREFLLKFGGHPAACGFSLESEKFNDFANKIREVASKKLEGADLRPKLKIEAELGLEEINEDLINDIEKFGPFGQGNDRPKFVSRGCLVLDKMNMGLEGQHIKLRLKSEDSGMINAIGFGQSQYWNSLAVGDKIDIVHYLDINEFNGKKEVQMKIVDIRKNF